MLYMYTVNACTCVYSMYVHVQVYNMSVYSTYIQCVYMYTVQYVQYIIIRTVYGVYTCVAAECMYCVTLLYHTQ